MQTKPKVLALAIFVFLLASAVLVYAAPSGPIVTLISNETKSAAPATKINTTGGSITIMRLYATTASGNINWSGVNCSNSTHLGLEDVAMNQTNFDDNISRTFNSISHSGFFVGTREILQNTCRSIHTLNSSREQSRFEEVALYDGTNTTNGNIIYSAPLQQDAPSFDNSTYDFQMIVPENGLATWTSSTAYYFYVELT